MVYIIMACCLLDFIFTVLTFLHEIFK